MLIKFCGIKYPSDIDAAISLGADFCGFIFHKKSPRYISPKDAGKLPVSNNIRRVGVFVSQSLIEILEIIKLAKLDLVQLHGNYSIEDAMAIGSQKVIRVLWPLQYKDNFELENELFKYAGSCSYYLLDAGFHGGGSGKNLDWHRLSRLKFPRPWILAGGLDPANIIEAINACNPDCVDINSGVEKEPGVKSPEKMLQITNIIRRNP